MLDSMFLLLRAKRGHPSAKLLRKPCGVSRQRRGLHPNPEGRKASSITVPSRSGRQIASRPPKATPTPTPSQSNKQVPFSHGASGRASRPNAPGLRSRASVGFPRAASAINGGQGEPRAARSREPQGAVVISGGRQRGWACRRPVLHEPTRGGASPTHDSCESSPQRVRVSTPSGDIWHTACNVA